MKSDHRVLPLPRETGLSGPDNDNSVMFSLGAVAVKAESTVSAMQAAATVHDSGLIDLKKMMANAVAQELPPFFSPLDAYPFGAPAEEATLLPQAFEAAKPAEAKTGEKNVKWLAMSFVLVASAVVAVGVLQMRSAQNEGAPEVVRMGHTVSAGESRPVEVVAPPTNSLVVKENTAATTTNNQALAATALPRPQRPVANPQQNASVTKGKTEAAPTLPAPSDEPCDLRCEIDRRMKKK